MASPSSLSVSQPTTYADTLCPPPAFHSIPGQAPVVIGLHYKRGPPRDGRLNLVCLSLVVDVLTETSRLSRIRRKTKRTRLLVSSRPIQKGNRAISSRRTSSTFRLECHLVDYPGHVIRQPARSNEGLEKHLDESDEKEKGKKGGRKEESGPMNTQTRGGRRSIFTFVPGNHGGVRRLPYGGNDRFRADRRTGEFGKRSHIRLPKWLGNVLFLVAFSFKDREGERGEIRRERELD